MKPREWSESGIYHAVQKGAGDQILFYSDKERQRYHLILQEELDKSTCRLLTWCLMSNHTHLLILDCSLPAVSALLRKIGQRYAQFFNLSHGHTGPVFQRPFYSEPIEDDSHFLSAVRYIHNNPEAAGICAAHKYTWSSYLEYELGAQIIDPEPVLAELGGIDGFKRFSRQRDDFKTDIDSHLARVVMNDDDALELARRVLRPDDPTLVKTMPRPQRDLSLRALREAGIGVRQASRITSLGKSTVARVYST